MKAPLMYKNSKFDNNLHPNSQTVNNFEHSFYLYLPCKTTFTHYELHLFTFQFIRLFDIMQTNIFLKAVLIKYMLFIYPN